MIRAIDDFLIDRCCQPIADRLDRWTCCYGIAAFFYTGGCLALAASAVCDLASGLHVFDAAGASFLALVARDRAREAHHLSARPAPSAMQAYRVADFPWRLMGVMGSAVLLSTVWMQSGAPNPGVRVLDLTVFFAGAFLRWGGGEYFMACRKRPPRYQESRPVPNATPAEA